METIKVAILMTCHNRRKKTLRCLRSLYQSNVPEKYKLHIFLVDDNSTDGTRAAVRKKYPSINVIEGNGGLYWAGGMRKAWQKALNTDDYEIFLLINDDVELKENFFYRLLATEKYSVEMSGKKGIYSCSTVDPVKGEITYGGQRIIRNHVIMHAKKIEPLDIPLRCDMANANILWVSREVVDEIGILDEEFIHSIADYDYSMRAKNKDIPVWITPGIGGYCENDHGVSWKPQKVSLRERIDFLKSPKGLEYKEYLYYIRRHFPLYLPYSFVMLWLKTFFPFLWSKIRR